MTDIVDKTGKTTSQQVSDLGNKGKRFTQVLSADQSFIQVISSFVFQ